MKVENIFKSALLVILLSFLVYQSFIASAERKTDTTSEEQEASPEENKEEDVKKTVDTQELSEFPGLHLRTETEESERYTLSITVPFTNNDELNEPIEAWINETKDEFFAAIEGTDPGENIPHLNVQVKTVQVKEKVYSLLSSAYKYTGGANGMEFVKPFIVDLHNNKILTLESIIPMNKSDQLAAVIKEEIQESNAAEDIDYESLETALADLTDLKWTINNQILTVYFDEYEIGPGSLGILNFEIPMSKIRGLLTEEVVGLFNIQPDSSEKDEQKEETTEQEEQNNQHKNNQNSESNQDNSANENNNEDNNSNNSNENNSNNETNTNESSNEKKYVALTFDDGPLPETTPRVLEELAKFNAKATFFMLGSQVEYYPQLAQQVAAAGHEVANHSQTHPDLTKLSLEKLEYQMETPRNNIEKATGIRPHLMRPPYGAVNDQVIAYAEKNNNSIIQWSVDTLDWQSKDPRAINDVIKRDVISGSIVLMHDIHPTTVDALPEALQYLSDEGYEFVTVSELMEVTNQSGAGPIYGKVK